MIPQQAVLLAGGTGSRLRPLNSTGTPKALLPIGNEPLISFPLRSLEEAGIHTVFVICFGESSAAKVQAWITTSYEGRLNLLVKSIPDDSSGSKTAGALRAVGDKLVGESILVISGDLVTNFPIKSLLVSQLHTSATCTSLFTRRASSPSAETKPGKAPAGVDYVGLDNKSKQLLYFDSSNESAKRSLKFSLAALERTGSLFVQTDLVDQHCYIFNRQAVLEILESKPTIHSIKEDLVPYIVGHQHRHHSNDATESSDVSMRGDNSGAQALPLNERSEWWAGAVIAPDSYYCKRTNTLTAYGDVNRDVTSSTELAGRFLSQKVNSEGYFRHESATVATKTMVGAGCMLGLGSRVGEKSTLKRSVVGAHCLIGSHVKLTNSVILDDVTIEDGCSIQNCILCSGSHIQAQAQLRDCQVGPACTVPSSSEHRGEIFDKLSMLKQGNKLKEISLSSKANVVFMFQE